MIKKHTSKLGNLKSLLLKKIRVVTSLYKKNANDQIKLS